MFLKESKKIKDMQGFEGRKELEEMINYIII